VRRRNKLSLDPELEEVFKWFFAGKIKAKCGSLEKVSLSLFYRQVKPNVAKEYPALKVSCKGKNFVIHVSQDVMSSISSLRIAYRLKTLTENLKEITFQLQRLNLRMEEEVVKEAYKLLTVYEELNNEIDRVKRFLEDAKKKGLLIKIE
jgi:hypothetical protein